jgi:CBS domain-containing protein
MTDINKKNEKTYLSKLEIDLQKAKSVKEIKKIHDVFLKQILLDIKKDKSIECVTKQITALSDAITQKLVNFAIAKLSKPPCKFAFIAMGSQARQEQTLKTDQDNAIIYEDIDVKSAKKTQKYFNKLAKIICDNLNFIGYDYCKGRVMAKNPKWCKPIEVWKKYFVDWIELPNPLELRKINIFFDFKCIYGDKKLTAALNRHINRLVRHRSVFFLHLAKNILHTKPPIGFFGNFLITHKGKHRHTFNIKQSMGIIVDFARIYGLRNNIKQTNTVKRLKQIYKKGFFEYSEYKNILYAYDSLMQIRLTNQAKLLCNNKRPNNYLNPKQLTNTEKNTIKKSFLQISDLSKKIKLLLQFGFMD